MRKVLDDSAFTLLRNVTAVLFSAREFGFTEENGPQANSDRQMIRASTFKTSPNQIVSANKIDNREGRGLI